MTEVGSN